MKTDPGHYDFVATGTVSITVASRFNGLTVASIEGGSVTRNGTYVLALDTLATGDVLTFTPTTTGGTTTLACQRSNEEFSGNYTDLNGAPSGGGSTAWADITGKPLGTVNGVATLGSDGKVPSSQLPASSGGSATAALIGRAVQNASQSLPGNTWTQVNLTRITQDAGGAMVAGTFTAPTTDDYDVSVGLVLSGGSGIYVNAAVRLNGTTEALKVGEDNIVGSSIALTGSGVLHLTAGQTLQVWAYSNGGTVYGESGKDLSTFSVARRASGGSGVPVVAATSAVSNGTAALLDDGANPPRVVYKRPDGTVWYGTPFSSTP
ncbi:hypothetical protein [Deinococcus ruber]|uniref:Uncharacterized protein n=1 Tax=Deinococcus ruber TaxID=1848197 RepID=A0A918F9S3_9DEIO|nr:hypothetical protein [Deinococcus ruber]GGR19035.1 hypothetical protein GCM10008957_34630 [Deinococcus ruber]